MATITVERGEKSYLVWNYLRERNIRFESYRNYGTNPPTYHQEWLTFDIEDEAVAVELALRYA